MIDLTKIEKPLCLLDAETREALEAYDGPLQSLSLHGRWVDFYGSGYDDDRSPGLVVRAAPQQLIAPTYPWDALHERFEWCAIDKNGKAYAHEQEPVLRDIYWSSTGAECIRLTGVFAGYERGGYGWETSLMRRPE